MQRRSRQALTMRLKSIFGRRSHHHPHSHVLFPCCDGAESTPESRRWIEATHFWNGTSQSCALTPTQPRTQIEASGDFLIRATLRLKRMITRCHSSIWTQKPPHFSPLAAEFRTGHTQWFSWYVLPSSGPAVISSALVGPKAFGRDSNFVFCQLCCFRFHVCNSYSFFIGLMSSNNYITQNWKRRRADTTNREMRKQFNWLWIYILRKATPMTSKSFIRVSQGSRQSYYG